jgi:uncharacterized membrane protein
MIKDLLVIIIVLILIDSIWLYLINSNYARQVESIQGEPMQINYLSAALVYILLAYGLYYFNKDEPLQSKRIQNSIILGLVSYGIYDFTNGTIFKKWDFKIATLDTLWGGILLGTTSYFVF